MNANQRISYWTILTLGIALFLAANSYSAYLSLTRQPAPAPVERSRTVSFSRAVWTGDPDDHGHEHRSGGDLYSLRRGLLINTTLAMVLVFAVAAGGSRK